LRLPLLARATARDCPYPVECFLLDSHPSLLSQHQRWYPTEQVRGVNISGADAIATETRRVSCSMVKGSRTFPAADRNVAGITEPGLRAYYDWGQRPWTLHLLCPTTAATPGATPTRVSETKPQLVRSGNVGKTNLSFCSQYNTRFLNRQTVLLNRSGPFCVIGTSSIFALLSRKYPWMM
jgi:hypothetical protein